MKSQKYFPEKILNIKEVENGNKIILIQWKGLSIQQATWEPQQKFPQLKDLIQQYEEKRINDKIKNYALKSTQRLDCGENPYQQTQRHGHFMYGDEPECIESIKIFQNPKDSEEKTTIVCEIKWKVREQIDEYGKVSAVILQNSFMDSKTINEFRPDFLIASYQKLIALNSFKEQN